MWSYRCCRCQFSSAPTGIASLIQKHLKGYEFPICCFATYINFSQVSILHIFQDMQATEHFREILTPIRTAFQWLIKGRTSFKRKSFVISQIRLTNYRLTVVGGSVGSRTDPQARCRRDTFHAAWFPSQSSAAGKETRNGILIRQYMLDEEWANAYAFVHMHKCFYLEIALINSYHLIESTPLRVELNGKEIRRKKSHLLLRYFKLELDHSKQVEKISCGTRFKYN